MRVFNYNTITPAISGYTPDDAFVDMTWNDDGDVNSGGFMVNVCSTWPAESQPDPASPVHPLTGSSFVTNRFTWGSSSETYSDIIPNLPDPMTFTVLASPQPAAAAEAQASFEASVWHQSWPRLQSVLGKMHVVNITLGLFWGGFYGVNVRLRAFVKSSLS